MRIRRDVAGESIATAIRAHARRSSLVARSAGGPPARPLVLRIRRDVAGEACAVLDLVDLPGGETQQHNLRRIGAMLAVLSR